MEVEVTKDKEEESKLSASEELYRINQARNEDGTVQVEILDWEKKNDDSVRVSFSLPTGEEASEEMEWPWPLSDNPRDYKFVRLCERSGYGIVGAEELRGSNYKTNAEYVDDKGWELSIPYEAQNKKEKVLSRFNGSMSSTLDFVKSVLLFPLILVIAPIMSIVTDKEDQTDMTSIEYGFVVGITYALLSVLCWGGLFYLYLLLF